MTATLTAQETSDAGLLVLAGAAAPRGKAVKRNVSMGSGGSSGPRPAARRATLNVPSQARKKAAIPRTLVEEVNAKGAAARNASTGSSARRRGRPGRRRDDDARAYSAAAAAA
uniref:Uncharacterized protein n=1 Tax=Triticum urartu TaxID=4572 RepID=A0A8R7TCC4_TRIUA